MAIIERINKNGDVVHQVRLKMTSGKWISGGTFTNRLDAEDQEVKLKKQLRIGEGKVLALEDGKTTSVDEYYEVWRLDRNSASGAGWWISKDQMFRDYLSPTIGRMKMSKVQIPDIARVLDRARKMGRSEQTVKHIYSLVRGMFSDAVEFYQMLEESPVRAKFHRPKVPKAKRKFLTPEQAQRLMAYVRYEAKPSDRYLSRPIWIQLGAALRVEAIQGLPWKNILWDSQQILISRAWKQKEGRMADYPKGKDWDYVAMPDDLSDYLWVEWQNVRDPDAFVCPGPKGGMLSYETYLRALKRMCRQAGVPEIATQESRHSSTEMWHQQGANQEDLRRLLNHKSLSSTSHYIHRTEARLISIAKKVKLRAIEGGGSFPNSFPNGKQEADDTQEKEVINE